MDDIKNKLLSSFIIQFNDSGKYCIYIHKNKDNEIFYTAIDKIDRSFSSKRPYYWNEFVTQELKGIYVEEILKTNVSQKSAIEIKDKILELYSEQLINTVNFHRVFNMEIFEVYSKALDDYKCFLNKAIGLEKSGNLDLAIGSYEYAYDAYIKAMNSRNYDATEKYLKAHSPPPPTNLVDRLSQCMFKLKQYQRLIDFSERYSCYFMRNERTKGELKLFERVSKANGIK